MESKRSRSWHLLGSTSWLRPLEEGDLPRLRAFLRRKDVLRGGNLAARLRPVAPARLRMTTAPGVALVAGDPFGAPAGIFHLREDRVGRTVLLSFAVPRGEVGVLRECLRLLTAALPGRTRAACVRIAGLDQEEEAARVLLASGWERDEDGSFRAGLISEGLAEEAPTAHAD